MMVESGIRLAYHALGNKEEPLGGPSGRGWSSLALLERCPELYRAVSQGDGGDEDSMPLQIGILFHTLLALHYSLARQEIASMNEGVHPAPESFYHAYLEVDGAPMEPMAEAWRIFQAYMAEYEEDYLEPLAVEYRAESKRLDYSCRYDLIVRVSDPPAGLRPGIYAVDHKTTARLNDANNELWFHDGEIVGQALLYGLTKLEKKFGEPLQGVIINIISKEKMPRFARLVVAPTEGRLADHMREVSQWRKIERRFLKRNEWPTARASCVGRYGKCPLYYNCNRG